jgi:4-amino-4-deoxy-L-arabinose transferase-like glycosyltransferase
MVWLLACLLVVAWGIRFGVASHAAPFRLLGDERYFARVATHIAAGKGHQLAPWARAWRPPAFSYVLAASLPKEIAASGDPAQSLERFIHVQLALGTALVAMVFLLGQALFDARTGLLAALIAATYPELVAYSHFLWSETLFAVLLVAGLVAVWYAEERASRLLALLGGAAFGLAALTREIAIPVAGVCAAWGVATARQGDRRAALLRAAVMMVAMAVTILPWTIRNHRIFHRFIPVSTVGWYAIAESNTLDQKDWLDPLPHRAIEFRRRYLAVRDELQMMELARLQAIQEIRSEQPSWIVKKLVRNVALLFQPDSYLAKKLRKNAYGTVERSRERAILAVTSGSYSLVLLAAMLGALTDPNRRRRLLVGALLVTVIALHVVATSVTRFRLPWTPLLIVYASHAFLNCGVVRARLRGFTAVAAVLLLCAFAWIAACYFPAWSHTAAVWRAPAP